MNKPSMFEGTQVNDVHALENFVQLHETVEIVYVVDGYIARLATHDSNRNVVIASKGNTILEALSALSRDCREHGDGVAGREAVRHLPILPIADQFPD